MTQSFSASRRTPLSAAIAIVTLVAVLVGTTPRPARADTASTTAVLLGAAAVAAGIIISNNVRHKQAQARQQVGRTRDGGIVYGDGRVVYPNGNVLYTGNGDGRRCSYDGEDEPCNGNPVAYYPRARHDNGRHNGWYKHHRHGDDDRGGDEGNRNRDD